MNQRGMGFLNLPPVVKNILIINVLMLIITMVVESTMHVDLRDYLGLHLFQSPKFKPYQIVTHMFMHADFMHLFFNMFALWMFGKVLEMVMGSKRFFIYYIATGLGAVILHSAIGMWEISQMQNDALLFANSATPENFQLFISDHLKTNPQILDFIMEWSDNLNNPNYAIEAKEAVHSIIRMRLNVPTVGASGAVFGILLAFGMLFPNVELMLLFPPIPLKAKYFVIGYGVAELANGLFNVPGDNVAHFAHLGGMIFGFLLLKLWKVKTGSRF